MKRTDMLQLIKKVLISLVLCLSLINIADSSEHIVIAVVKSRNIEPYNLALQGFKSYLDTKGSKAKITEYIIEGKSKDELEVLREEISSGNPDLVLTIASSATLYVQKNIKNIPNIFTMVLDPERSNISPPGVAMEIPIEVKLAKIKEILPYSKTIGLVYSPDTAFLYEEISEACRNWNFRLISRKIDSGRELPDVFEDISPQMDWFLMVADSKIYFPKSVEYLLRESLRKKVAVIGLSSSYTKAGAFIAFDCDYKDLGAQTAEVALKILHGQDSDNMRFFKPRKTNLSLNSNVAKILGIKVTSEMGDIQ